MGGATSGCLERHSLPRPMILAAHAEEYEQVDVPKRGLCPVKKPELGKKVGKFSVVKPPEGKKGEDKSNSFRKSRNYLLPMWEPGTYNDRLCLYGLWAG